MLAIANNQEKNRDREQYYIIKKFFEQKYKMKKKLAKLNVLKIASVTADLLEY